MTMSQFAVVLPFQAFAESPGDMPCISIQAVASTPRTALAVADAFVGLCCRRRYGVPPQQVGHQRARIGGPGPVMDSPYAYVLGRSNHIAVAPIPRRLDHASTTELRQRITGLVAAGADTVIIDAALLTFLDSSALATLSTLSSLAHNSRGLTLHLFRPSAPIRKVFEIVGLSDVLGIHDSLAAALQGAVEAGATRPQTRSIRRVTEPR